MILIICLVSVMCGVLKSMVPAVLSESRSLSLACLLVSIVLELLELGGPGLTLLWSGKEVLVDGIVFFLVVFVTLSVSMWSVTSIFSDVLIVSLIPSVGLAVFSTL